MTICLFFLSKIKLCPERLVKKLPVHKGYTISSIEDSSHGSAKRYSLNIILIREHTQAEIIELIKTATREAINTEYHRSEITRRHWRDQPAHVVWLLVYPSVEDAKNNNLICQSEWFSHEIESEFLPIPSDGETNRYIKNEGLKEHQVIKYMLHWLVSVVAS